MGRRADLEAEVLDGIWRLGVVDTRAAAGLWFGGRLRAAQRKLRSLCAAGMVERVRAGGREGYAHRIAPAGLERIWRREGKRPAPRLIRHDLEAARICAGLVMWARRRGVEAEVAGVGEAVHLFRDRGGRLSVLKPDALVFLDQRPVFVEYEMTMHRTSQRRKLRKWRGFLAARAWRDGHRKEPFMLVVAEESARLQRAGAVARAEPLPRAAALLREAGAPRVLLAGSTCIETGDWWVLVPPYDGEEVGLWEAMEGRTGRW